MTRGNSGKYHQSQSQNNKINNNHTNLEESE
jgi:hypothetical protein